ncbi:MAG TPA: hypothetical protein VM388_01225 [Acidimicrobiales bacterium]|nr:hypothetical protein [Acidimicrobiales bacterium]
MARPERRWARGAVAAAALMLGALGVAAAPAAHGDPLLTCPETPVLHQVCSVATAVPNLAADGVEAVAEGIFDQATEWVVAGAKSVVGYIGETIDDGTRPDPAASWFEPNYRLMVSVGVAFLLPLLIVASLWSLLRHDATGVVRIVTVKLPVAAMGMVVATWVVDMLVAVTDNLSAFVGSTIGGSGERFATGVVHLMEATLLTGNAGVTGFLAFLVALVIALLALLLWIELVVRQAAVLAATLFLPLGFAGLVWESTSHWLRKLAEGLLAFILAKFVITAIVAVGANAVAAGGDHPAALILGAGILAVAVFTPYVLLSIIPLGTLAVAQGLSRRPLQAGSSAMSSLYWGQALLGAGGGAAANPLPAAPTSPSGGGAIPPPPAGPVGGGTGGAAAAAGGAATTAPLAVAAGGAQAARGAVQAVTDVAQTAPMPAASPPTPPGGGDGR